MLRTTDRAGLALLQMLCEQHGTPFFGQLAQLIELRTGRLPYRFCRL